MTPPLLSVNLKDNKQRTALSFAAELGHPEVTAWLLQAGADVSAPCAGIIER